MNGYGGAKAGRGSTGSRRTSGLSKGQAKVLLFLCIVVAAACHDYAVYRRLKSSAWKRPPHITPILLLTATSLTHGDHQLTQKPSSHFPQPTLRALACSRRHCVVTPLPAHVHSAVKAGGAGGAFVRVSDKVGTTKVRTRRTPTVCTLGSCVLRCEVFDPWGSNGTPFAVHPHNSFATQTFCSALDYNGVPFYRCRWQCRQSLVRYVGCFPVLAGKLLLCSDHQLQRAAAAVHA